MFTSGQNGGHFNNTPKTGLTEKFAMAPYHIIIATISLYNKQFHRHFGSKKVLNFVYFQLDDIYFRSKWQPV